MNHQPFRDWLLSEDKLTEAQDQMLQEHISTCESCQQIKQSWQEVEWVFLKAPMVLPEPGFASRWQMSLIKYQQQRQKQKNIQSIGVIAALVLGLSVLLIYQLWFFIQNPEPFLAFWFTQLMNLLSIFSLAHRIVSPYTAITPAIAFFSMILLAGGVSFFSVLWLAAYRKLSLVRRSI